MSDADQCAGRQPAARSAAKDWHPIDPVAPWRRSAFTTLHRRYSLRTITVSDSGGMAEFVLDHENGLIVPPDQEAIAAAFDLLYMTRTLAKRTGSGGMA
jgi:glycosyltransferase involved in cell wall biosynthesis